MRELIEMHEVKVIFGCWTSVSRKAVLPVVEDNNTTAVFDFDRNAQETLFLANLLDKFTPLFLFDVEVLDEFGRIEGNQRVQDLITALIERIKPAHTRSFVEFITG